MNLNKKPISDMKIYYGMPLMRAIVTPMDGNDPQFGGLVKDSYNYAAVEKVTVVSIKPSEDNSGLIVDVLRVDMNNKPIQGPNGEEPVIKDQVIAFDQASAEFKENVWCDEDSRVQELCAKLNKQSKAKLEMLYTAVKGKMDFVQSLIEEGA